MAVTKPMADYLAAIYRHLPEDGRVTTGEIARAMGVSSASATYMFKKLAAQDLVEYKGYMGVSLSEAGRRIALRVIRAHRLTERYLTDALGFSWDEVDEIAHAIDHSLPEVLTERFDSVLGGPRTCPHGHPIPTSDGRIIQPRLRMLRDLEPGERGTIAQIEEDDPEMLRFLDGLTLRPGRTLQVLSKNPLDFTMSVETETTQTMIGEPIIECIVLLDDSVVSSSVDAP